MMSNIVMRVEVVRFVADKENGDYDKDDDGGEKIQNVSRADEAMGGNAFYIGIVDIQVLAQTKCEPSSDDCG